MAIKKMVKCVECECSFLSLVKKSVEFDLCIKCNRGKNDKTSTKRNEPLFYGDGIYPYSSSR